MTKRPLPAPGPAAAAAQAGDLHPQNLAKTFKRVFQRLNGATGTGQNFVGERGPS